MKRGEVWRVRLPTVPGHTQAGERPALIMQDDPFNATLPTVLIVPFTSTQATLRFAGTLLIQLGGPGMLIGIGGGAASSMATGTNTADLDFDSVQRGNAEIQRRAQEVIDRCWQSGERNPILSVHDVGAGLVNQLGELCR